MKTLFKIRKNRWIKIVEGLSWVHPTLFQTELSMDQIILIQEATWWIAILLTIKLMYFLVTKLLRKWDFIIKMVRLQCAMKSLNTDLTISNLGQSLITIFSQISNQIFFRILNKNTKIWVDLDFKKTLTTRTTIIIHNQREILITFKTQESTMSFKIAIVSVPILQFTDILNSIKTAQIFPIKGNHTIIILKIRISNTRIYQKVTDLTTINSHDWMINMTCQWTIFRIHNHSKQDSIIKECFSLK